LDTKTAHGGNLGQRDCKFDAPDRITIAATQPQLIVWLGAALQSEERRRRYRSPCSLKIAAGLLRESEQPSANEDDQGSNNARERESAAAFKMGHCGGGPRTASNASSYSLSGLRSPSLASSMILMATFSAIGSVRSMLARREISAVDCRTRHVPDTQPDSASADAATNLLSQLIARSGHVSYCRHEMAFEPITREPRQA
jgi:hypothetical protein